MNKYLDESTALRSFVFKKLAQQQHCQLIPATGNLLQKLTRLEILLVNAMLLLSAIEIY